MPSVYIKTYGCQMNERDSEAVAAQLSARGYSLAPSEEGADVVLINTCSVRDLAEQKAIGKMAHMMGTGRSRKGRVYGFMGCMAQSRGRELVDRLPDLGLVLGTQKFHRAGEYLDRLLSGDYGRICDTGAEEGSESAIREHLPGPLPGRKPVSAFVSIMQGCNQRCAFCIVPDTRGAERSRPVESIVAECEELVDGGTREVVLLGQIVTSYGRREIGRRDGKSAFVQLLEALHRVPGLERIRFTSPHPRGYGEDLIDAYGRLPRLCPNAHIPVQSGSDRILRAMRRGYTRDRFLGIVEKLRSVRPRIGLTTDIIVAFPGESEEEFRETLSLVEEVRFDNAFVFKYSPRRGTPAAGMEQIPPEVNRDRHARLLERVSRIGLDRYREFLGRRVSVLVEGPSRRNPDRLQGRTPCNKIVVIEGDERLVGTLQEVEIHRTGSFTLYGNP